MRQAYIGYRYFTADDDLLAFGDVSNLLHFSPHPWWEGSDRPQADPGAGAGADSADGAAHAVLPDPSALLAAVMSLGNAAIHLQAAQLLEAEPDAEIYITGADGQLHPLG